MRIGDFIEGVLKALDVLSGDTKSSDIWVKLESHFAMIELVNFLQNYPKKSDELNDRTLQRFCDFMSDRWVGTRHTMAAYPCDIQSKANRAYQIFAHAIVENSKPKPGENTPYQSKFQVNEILMPSVAAIMVRLTRPRFDDFQWQEIVLGDDGTPIEVFQCLENAFADESLELHHTCKMGILSAAERYRVIHQSEATEAYYEALEYFLKTEHVVDLFAAQEQLQQQIQQNSYVVKDAYGLEGRKRLAKHVLSHIKTADEFIAIVEKYVPYAEWPSFFESIGDEELQRLFAKDFNLAKAIQHPQSWTGDVGHDRILLYSLSEIFRRERATQKPAEGAWNYLTAFNKEYLGKYRRFFKGITPAEQQAAATVFQVFLRANRPLYEFDKFLDENHITDEQRAPFYELGSPLALLVSQMKKICDPAYFNNPTTQNFFSRFRL